MRTATLLTLLLAATFLQAQETPEKPAPEPASPQAKPPATPVAENPGGYEGTVPRPTRAEVKYGPDARNVLE